MADIDIEEELKYPLESDDWVMTVLVGGALLLFSFLILPIFLVYGYIVRVVRSSLEGASEPPAMMGDWGEMFVDGLKGFVIYLAYGLIPTIVFIMTVGLSFIALLTGSEGGFLAGFGGLIIGGLVSIVLFVVFGYFGAVGFVNFVREDSLTAAFDIGTIKQVALSKEYAVPFLIGVGVVIGVSFVANLIPIIGFLIALPGSIYAYIVLANLMTKGFQAALGIETGGQSSADQPPAGQTEGVEF